MSIYDMYFYYGLIMKSIQYIEHSLMSLIRYSEELSLLKDSDKVSGDINDWVITN